VEVLDVADVLGRALPGLDLPFGAHLRPVQEIDVALLENFAGLVLLGLPRHRGLLQRRSAGVEAGCCDNDGFEAGFPAGALRSLRVRRRAGAGAASDSRAGARSRWSAPARSDGPRIPTGRPE